VFVGATAPPLRTRRASADGGDKGARAGGHLGRGINTATPSGRGQNPIVAALRPIVTGTGTGPLLPIVAGAAALLILLMVALRARGHRGTRSGEP
jgi:hypothetical protein